MLLVPFEVIKGALQTILHHKPIVWAENTGYFDRQDTTFLAVLHQVGGAEAAVC